MPEALPVFQQLLNDINNCRDADELLDILNNENRNRLIQLDKTVLFAVASRLCSLAKPKLNLVATHSTSGDNRIIMSAWEIDTTGADIQGAILKYLKKGYKFKVEKAAPAEA